MCADFGRSLEYGDDQCLPYTATAGFGRHGEHPELQLI
jgi:hypothetical protein